MLLKRMITNMLDDVRALRMGGIGRGICMVMPLNTGGLVILEYNSIVVAKYTLSMVCLHLFLLSKSLFICNISFTV